MKGSRKTGGGSTARKKKDRETTGGTGKFHREESEATRCATEERRMTSRKL